MDNAIRCHDIGLLDVGPIDLHARGRYQRGQRSTLQGHYVPWLYILSQEMAGDHVIAQNRLELCGVFEQRLECAMRKFLECFVGWRKNRERAFSRQLIG